MLKVSDINEYLCAIAPVELKMDFDNVGHLVGRSESEVKTVLIALDITEAVIGEAIALGAELILSHHPLFFAGLSTVVSGTPTGDKILKLAEHKMSAICMHTNLDAAEGGVNDCLAKAMGAHVLDVLNNENGISRVARLPESMTLSDFMSKITEALNCRGLRYHDAGKPVELIGLCGGAGDSDLELAATYGCDTYVTADIKYHHFLRAAELGINLIDADHFCTENVITDALANKLRERFGQALRVEVSKVHEQTAHFYCK